MGQSITRMFSAIFDGFGNKEKRIVMVGLDAAGKTTVLYQLKLGEVINTIPTVGFNVDTVQYKNIDFTVWDVGGQDRIRPLWHHYYLNTDAIIFVVDSSDTDRIDNACGYDSTESSSAATELYRLLQEDCLRDAAILVLANKQDLPNALKINQVADRLGLNKVRSHRWHVQGCCATSGDGLYEGLDWLADVLKN